MEEKANLNGDLQENLSGLGTEEKFLKSYLLCGTNCSEDKIESVKNAKLKSMTLTVVLSAFLGLFGAGSFYLGYWKRGICKIIFNVLVPLALGMVFLFWLAPMYNTYSLQADNTVLNIAYKKINEYYEGYSMSYDDLNARYHVMTSQNEILKTVYKYFTEEDDSEKETIGFTTSFASMVSDFNGLFTVKLINNINSLSSFGELMDENEYNRLKEGLSKTSVNYTVVMSKIDTLLSDAEISSLIETARIFPTNLTAGDFDEIIEKIPVINEQVENILNIKDTDMLYDALEPFEYSINNLSGVTLKKAEIIGKVANLQTLFDKVNNNLKAKYLVLTGKSYMPVSDRKEDLQQSGKTLSAELEELINALQENNRELAEILNQLKRKVEALNVNFAENIIGPLTAFITEENEKPQSAFTVVSELNENLNLILAALNNLPIDRELVYKMTEQASLFVEYLNTFKDCTVEKGAEKQLNYTEVSAKYVEVLNAIDSLTEINYKIYDTEEDKIFYDSRIKDIESLMEHIDGANTIASDYTTKATDLSNEWKVDCKIINMLFIIAFCIRNNNRIVLDRRSF